MWNIRWGLLVQTIHWSVTVLIASWVYFLTDWVATLDNAIGTLVTAIELLRQGLERFRI